MLIITTLFVIIIKIILIVTMSSNWISSKLSPIFIKVSTYKV